MSLPFQHLWAGWTKSRTRRWERVALGPGMACFHWGLGVFCRDFEVSNKKCSPISTILKITAAMANRRSMRWCTPGGNRGPICRDIGCNLCLIAAGIWGIGRRGPWLADRTCLLALFESIHVGAGWQWSSRARSNAAIISSPASDTSYTVPPCRLQTPWPSARFSAHMSKLRVFLHPTSFRAWRFGWPRKGFLRSRKTGFPISQSSLRACIVTY